MIDKFWLAHYIIFIYFVDEKEKIVYLFILVGVGRKRNCCQRSV